MSLLSYDDIIRELGNNIFVYPLIGKNIKGSSLNLTPSKLAWSLSTGDNVYNEAKNAIVLDKGDTVLVETEEAIHVTEKIGGSYHSKVKVVSRGIGHIGTTLDPGWIGPSLIALHNTTQETVEVDVGETFITIMFFWNETPSTKRVSDPPGRPDIFHRLNVTDAELAWLDEDWRKEYSALSRKMRQSEEYNKLKLEQKRATEKIKSMRWHSRIINTRIGKVVIICLLYLAIWGILSIPAVEKYLDMSKRDLFVMLFSSIVPVLAVLLITSKAQIKIDN